jgi:hypothetical protein
MLNASNRQVCTRLLITLILTAGFAVQARIGRVQTPNIPFENEGQVVNPADKSKNDKGDRQNRLEAMSGRTRMKCHRTRSNSDCRDASRSISMPSATRPISAAVELQRAEGRSALGVRRLGKDLGQPDDLSRVEGGDSAPDHFEGKLLLGRNIASGWHWGSNFVWEHELGGPQENSNEWTVGISHTVKDSKIDVGIETQLALVSAIEAGGRRGDFSTEFLVGRSFQFRPMPQTHIDVAPLFGTTHDALRSKIFVVLGYEF